MKPNKSAKALRVCIVLEWAAIVLSVVLAFSLERQLPDELRYWIESEDERPTSTVYDLMILLVLLPLLLVYIVSSVGLFFRRRWAGPLYVGSAVVMSLATVLLGPIVEHAVAAAVDDFAMLLSGVVIGLILFTDALPPAPPPLPGAPGSSDQQSNRS